jgi:RNA chaperone Hfq
MKKHKTLEESQLALIEFLEKEGEFRGTFKEISDLLGIKKEMIVPLLNSLKASGDIVFELLDDELIIRPSSTPIVPPILTPEQEREIDEKLKEGYKLVASSLLGGVQSRILRKLINKRVVVFFRTGSKAEGKLKAFDRFTMKLTTYRGKMLIYKHAVTSIVYKD